MGNVLSESEKEKVVVLGGLGWSLRRIEKQLGVRRETAAKYLAAAGVGVRPPGGWGRYPPKPAKQVITDSGGGSKAANEVITDSDLAAESKPANEVITDLADGLLTPSPAGVRSVCQPYRELILTALEQRRNA